MKRKTKTKRLQEIMDEYRRRHPGPFTIESVVDWALSRGLFPVPGRKTVEVDAAAEWDERFAAVAKEDVVAA